jgi:curved DNA-binding protein CbpA
MPSARNHYDTLNVSPDAEAVVIEAAYRALMKKYHPDQGAPAAEGAASAATINEAYGVLRDAARRAEYDRVEWIRQKDFRIAHYNATIVSHPSKFFGWGGWLVALVLAGMIGILASRGVSPQAAIPGLSRAEAPALPAPVPALGSQPGKPDERVMRAAEEAARVDARVSELIARSPPPPSAAATGGKALAPAARPYLAPPRLRYRAPRRGPARPPRLERQGGIY